MGKTGRGGRRNHKLNRPSSLSSSATHSTQPFKKTLPENLICEILFRVPVKSLIRFRCVSKSWLLRTHDPRFISMHLKHNTLCNNKKLICNTYAYDFKYKNCWKVIAFIRVRDPIIPVLEIDLDVKVKDDFTGTINFADFSKDMVMVGSINGVICLSSHLREVKGRFVALWNPGINMWKLIRLPGPEFLFESDREGFVGYVSSIGLGFVAEEDDFRIVRIVPVHRGPESRECWSRVEVYSVNSDSWIYVDNEDCIPFWPNLPNSNFILEGVPYFVGVDLLPEDLGTYNPYLHEVLAAFDPLTRAYKKISYPMHVKNKTTCVHPLNWKDSVAALVQSPGKYPNHLVDMYVLDKNNDNWTKVYTIEHAFEGLRILQCLTTGEIVLETWKGNNIAKRTPYFCYPETRDHAYYNGWFDYLDPLWGESYIHIESLICVKGMETTGKEKSKKNRSSRKNWTVSLSKDFGSGLHLN
ncbi:hypothetical protein AgCh_033508 [Apium graveolens]